LKIKSILVSQPQPETEKSPYHDLAKKYNLKVDFRAFIHVEGIPARDFRKSKINLADFTGIIFTSRYAVDHFFRISEEMRYTVPDSLKYYCISESIAFYLQKYTVYRKRKVFSANSKSDDLMKLLEKHRTEKFLLPLSDIHKPEIPQKLDKAHFFYKKAIIYKTVISDLSDLEDVFYDILVFFSPSGITSLFHNFPDFKQNDTRIAAFGPATAKAVKKAGLRLDINAPTPQNPSMTAALEDYIRKANKETSNRENGKAYLDENSEMNITEEQQNGTKKSAEETDSLTEKPTRGRKLIDKVKETALDKGKKVLKMTRAGVKSESTKVKNGKSISLNPTTKVKKPKIQSEESENKSPFGTEGNMNLED
jgi:uroporphyrinogen-III synthase